MGQFKILVEKKMTEHDVWINGFMIVGRKHLTDKEKIDIADSILQALAAKLMSSKNPSDWKIIVVTN